MPRLMPPPVADPRTPALKLPPGTVDCHMHLFGPYDRYPPVPETGYVTVDCLAETYIAMMDRFGIAKGVFIPASPHGTDPTHLVDALTQYPDRFIGVAILPRDVGRAEIRRLTDAGVKGARFQSPSHGSKLPGLSIETAAKIHEYGWHVQLYPGENEIAEMEPLVGLLPNRVVFDHFAAVPARNWRDQIGYRPLMRMIDTGRVWIKLSRPSQITSEAMPYSAVSEVARALVAQAPERILWGTDWPHVGFSDETMPDDSDLVDLLLDWIPDEKVRTRILVDNPREFYALGDG